MGERLPAVRIRPPGPRSREMGARLSNVESRNVTFRGRDFPVFWSEARGSNVRDADGNIYIDLTAAFGVAAAGHGHPRIVEAIRRQVDHLVHGMGDVHPPALKVELLERLCALSPWADARGVLASSGSEAVEIALKTAQLATGRSRAIAFEGAYHGLTLGALSTTDRELFRSPFVERLRGDVSFMPFPEVGGRTNGEDEAARCLQALDDTLAELETDGAQPGAIIVEPIQGRAGVRVPPPGFLSGVAERTRRAGALLVFDEIFTGLGRTGSLFAFEHEGVTPDLLCLGKALGGGLPLSCCLGPAAVMDAWPASEGEAMHTSTFLGHPLSCAASIAFLDVVEEEGLPERARTEGDRFRARLEEALSKSGRSLRMSGRGLFLGVAPARHDRGTMSRFGVRAATGLLQEGVLVLPAGAENEVVELTPPLTISRRQLDWCVPVLAEVLRSADN